MLFSYECQKCGKRFDGEYPIGQAPRTTPCQTCKGNSKRVYEGMSIAVKVSGRAPSSTFGEQMKAKNAAAAYRQKGRKAPVRLAALDYGNGKVEEVKK